MKISLLDVYVRAVDNEIIDQINWRNRELSEDYPSNREEHLKEIDKLKSMLEDEIYQLEMRLEELKGKHSNLF